MDADVIVVGGGLAGLVAACELVDAGRKVILLDQEGEQSLGGQAFWSFGGLFFVDSPEQRRLGIRDSHELALQDWMGSAGFDRAEDHLAAQVGRGLRRLRGGREARVAARPGRALVSRSSAGPSAAATARPSTATRCRASTSPGAPGRACSSRSSRACARAREAGPRVAALSPSRQRAAPATGGVVDGVRGEVLEPSERRARRARARARSSASSRSRRRR